MYRHPEYDYLTVAADAISGLGTFVETEIKANWVTDTVANLVEEVERRIGIATCQVVTVPYRDLLRSDMALESS